MNTNSKISLLFLAFWFAGLQSAHALEPPFDRIGATVGASWRVGSLKNSDAGLKSRTMDALSIQVSPGYRIGRFFVGPSFDYHFQGQMTSLETAGGTNLKG